MNNLTDAQSAEIAKYYKAYQNPEYRIKDPRKGEAEAALCEAGFCGSYLDVSCGRGEMVAFARRMLGFDLAVGTEVVPGLLNDDVCYALAWDLPFSDNSFQIVSLFDVIEHILPGDDERVCRELARVASKVVLLTTNKHPGYYHINCREYDRWQTLFEEWFAPGEVRRLPGRAVSKMWRVDL